MTPDKLFKELIQKVSDYNPNFDLAFLKRAYLFAKKAHKGQKRQSGEDYIIHPLYTALNLARIHGDEISLAAALLHDVPEDTKYKLEDLRQEFGMELALVVSGVTKMSKIYYKDNMQDREIDFLRRFFISAGKDFRTILVKICDRLHNLQTLDHLREDKRIRIAKESLEIYAPIISLLSLGEFMGEFEDACFKHINPEKYQEIYNNFGKKREFYEEKIELIKEKVLIEISHLNVEARVSGRIKSLYSIFKKIESKNLSSENIHDVIALRLVVESTSDCYLVIGVLHSVFRVKNDKFKDYISSPKNNGYQSIHTTVFDLDGEMIEFQVQTESMRKLNKYGFASHYVYKNKDSEFGEVPGWIKNILELQKKNPNSEDFLDGLKGELFSNYVFCFTPHGDQVSMPHGSTLLDYAYEIHNDFGNKFQGAYVNGEYKENPITLIKDGDVIFLLKSNKINEDFSVDFIEIVKTNAAKDALRKLFRKQSEEKRINLGRLILNKELDSFGLRHIESLNQKFLGGVYKEFRSSSKLDLYSKIGSGDIDVNRVLKFLLELNQSQDNTKKVNLKIYLKMIDPTSIANISRIFAELKINISNFKFKEYYCDVTFFIKNFDSLKSLLSELKRVPNVKDVERVFPARIVFIYILLISTLILILLNPLIFKYLTSIGLITGEDTLIARFSMFTTFGVMFFAIYFFRLVSKITLGDVLNRKFFWSAIVFLSTLALGEVFWQSYQLDSGFDSVIFLGFTLIIYTMLAFDYISTKLEK